MKKFLSLLLIAALLSSLLVFPVSAAEEDLDAIRAAVQAAAEAVARLDSEGGASYAELFRQFMSAVSIGGTLLTAINGSVTFMKLIGLIDDPVTSGIRSILEQMEVIDAKMDEVQRTLNDLTVKIIELQATAEFNERGRKAEALRQKWVDFSHYYMEDGLDELIKQYNAMAVDGIKAWCLDTNGARAAGQLDNTDLILLYDAEGKLITTGFEKEILSHRENGTYAVIRGDILPQRIVWDVNTYKEDIAAAVAQAVSAALAAGNYDAFESRGVPLLTPEGASGATEEAVARLAEDAVTSLVYRVTFNKVNEKADFAYSVDKAFTEYCSHLTGTEDGVDAMLKAMYLTHAFELQIAQELTGFCDRMIAKTGVYDVFAAEVMGMSDTLSDSVKTGMMQRFADTVAALVSAKETCVTGDKTYSYITGTPLEFRTMYFSQDLTVNTTEWRFSLDSYQRFENASASRITNSLKAGESLIGDANGLLLLYTLKSNGISTNVHDYLDNHIGDRYTTDYGFAVLSFHAETSLPIDGKIPFERDRVIGKWFTDADVTFLNAQPSGVEQGYYRAASKVTGSTVDLDSISLSADQPLLAGAIYGEGHGYWQKDEAALFTGPSYYAGFFSSMTRTKTGEETYRYVTGSKAVYDVIVRKPSPALSTGEGYDALGALRQLNRELEEQFREPEEPGFTECPAFAGAFDPELDAYVRLDEAEDAGKVREACEAQVRAAAGEAGAVLTEEEIAGLADRMEAEKNAAEELLRAAALRVEDPLGTGQNSEQLRELACRLMPAYLLDEEGQPLVSLGQVFARLSVRAVPTVRWENGEPVTGIDYEAVPYLLISDISSGERTVTAVTVSPDALREESLTVRVKLPAGGEQAQVFFLDASRNETGSVLCSAADGAVSFCVSDGTSRFRVAQARPVPPTGDDSGAALWSLCLSAACLLFLLKKRSVDA